MENDKAAVKVEEMERDFNQGPGCFDSGGRKLKLFIAPI